MRNPFSSLFSKASPFEGLQEHAEKVKECGWAFQQAIECHGTETCKRFEEYHQEVSRLENEADAIKRRIRGHLPRGSKLPVSRYHLFMYLREQDKVLDSVQEALDWISYRPRYAVTENLKQPLFQLADSVIGPIEDLSRMVTEAKKYFETYSDRQRTLVKDVVHNLRKKEHEADQIEDRLKHEIFTTEKDPVGVFHLVKLAESIGSVADHAENAGGIMRAMLAREARK